MTAPRLFAAAAVASALFALPAMAQDPASTTPPVAPPMPTEPLPTDDDTMPPVTEPAPIPVETPAPPPSATTTATDVSATAPTVTTRTVTNGPIPDTAENRAKYGEPMSATGKRTKPANN